MHILRINDPFLMENKSSMHTKINRPIECQILPIFLITHIFKKTLRRFFRLCSIRYIREGLIE